MDVSKNDDRESRLNHHQISAFDNEPASPGLMQYDKGGVHPNSLDKFYDRGPQSNNTASP